ncbi:hypothetical protein C8034_v008328 [Colletotrichum sidae]|uniref:Uncharacterized protein n=1 Tax=Colletotrichum sidae TaxID=1347389 RepID=A0A4R8TR63_9PEZI|nr:hypothetical protein C8034_v008328 [Colletotrichum sidae]
MSSTDAILDVVLSPLKITERTILPRSDGEPLWNKIEPIAFDCPESLLLVWPIFGPITDIAVLDSTAAPGEALKNRQPIETEDSAGLKTFHPVALLPVTYPRLSHITASAGIFDDFLEVSDGMTELHGFNWTEEPELAIQTRKKANVPLGKTVCAVHEWPHALREGDGWGRQAPEGRSCRGHKAIGVGSREQTSWNSQDGRWMPRDG